MDTEPLAMPTVTAMFKDGPLKGSRTEVDVVEGRPPMTTDSPGPDGSTCRYCLAGLVQGGRTAVYEFLYLV